VTPDEIAALDPGIRKTVLWLRAYGFETTDSGDGVSKFADAPAGAPADDNQPPPTIDPLSAACAMPVPNVAITVKPDQLISEARRLRALIAECGETLRPCGPTDEGCQMQATYDPADESATILLIGFVR
jgi:hypothetical protein